MEIEEDIDPIEEITQRHKKEKKELQSKIQVLKKSATKGDKKKKKEVQEEIAKLEKELSDKQEAELADLKANETKETNLTDAIEDVNVKDSKAPRITKAQKRRDKKAADQKERDKRILEQEQENVTGLRNVETQKIKEILKKMGLMIYEIEADGNCLYNAVDHQLKSKINSGYGTKQLRLETSQQIRSNINEYLPFLSNVNTGEMMTEEEFQDYCTKVANTTNWGGQVELRALSHVLKKSITVIQADGPPLVMGEEYSDSESLVVSYHRHMYRLGEHYNSVQPYADESNNF